VSKIRHHICELKHSVLAKDLDGEDYGVVIDPETIKTDPDATTKLRESSKGVWHYFPFSSKAARIFSGVMGRVVILTPMAS